MLTTGSLYHLASTSSFSAPISSSVSFGCSGSAATDGCAVGSASEMAVHALGTEDSPDGTALLLTPRLMSTGELSGASCRQSALTAGRVHFHI